MNEKRVINWGFNPPAQTEWVPQRGRRHFAIHAALIVSAGLAAMSVHLVLKNESAWEVGHLFLAGSNVTAAQESFQNKANSPASPTGHQPLAQEERQPSEVLAFQLASAQEVVENLTARVRGLTDEKSEAEKALHTAHGLAAEQKLSLERERARGDTLFRELVSARDEVEARKSAANAASAEQMQATEQERQRAELLAHQLASSQVDIATLMARVRILTDERSEAEKALKIAQASAAEQKQTLEQERAGGDTFFGRSRSRKVAAESLYKGGVGSRIEAARAALPTVPASSSTTVSPLVNAAARSESGSADDHSAAATVGKGGSEISTGGEQPVAGPSEPVAAPSRPAVIQSAARPISEKSESKSTHNATGPRQSTGNSRLNPHAPRRGSRERTEFSTRFPEYSQWVRDRFPDSLKSARLRYFGNRGAPGKYGRGMRRGQSQLRLFGAD